jgi:hypothetical protein
MKDTQKEVKLGNKNKREMKERKTDRQKDRNAQEEVTG